MARQKKSAEQRNAEATAERLLKDHRECHWLAELTDHREIKNLLANRAAAYGAAARRWQDYATELEYAHLYEGTETGA